MEVTRILGKEGEIVEQDSPFYTAWARPVADFSEVPEEGSITETAYVPPQVQIMDMMDAGRRLAEARRARFDSVSYGLRDDEDVPLDITRGPNVDVVDVQKAAEGLKVRLDEAQTAEDKKKADEAAKAAKEADEARINALLEKRWEDFQRVKAGG